MIVITILFVASVIAVVWLLRQNEKYITLEEVISGARIVSQEEGIIEYNGVQFILGTHDLKKRKRLIESLRLIDLDSSCVVDLRFNTQIIIKRGPSLNPHKPGPEDM